MVGRSLWIQPDDVDGPVDEGQVVKATRSLSDWCLRGDDGSEPVAAGTLLEIVEVRPWGASMAQELPDVQPLDTSPDAIMQAALELETAGLFEIVNPSTGDMAVVNRAHTARVAHS